MDAARAWADAVAATALFAVDPIGCGGVHLRAHAGPVRELWLELLRDLLPPATPVRRLPVHIGDDRLLGGLDLAATLRAGRPVAELGLLAASDGGVIVAPMAERMLSGTAARLAAVLDHGEVVVERDGVGRRSPARVGLVLLDEGIGDDERAPAALLDRLALRLDINQVSLAMAGAVDDALAWGPSQVADARALLGEVEADAATIEALCTTAMALGIDSLRAPALALRAARAAAALAGRTRVEQADAELAARLVLAPRATRLPAAAETDEDPPRADDDAPPPPDTADDASSAPPEPPAGAGTEPGTGTDQQPPPETPAPAPPPATELLLEAARAALPAGLLAQLQAGAVVTIGAAGSGRSAAQAPGQGRGRPIGTRRGMPRGAARLNVVETLRAAAPWQTLRRREALAVEGQGTAAGPAGRVEVRADDFRITRHRQRSETVTIFVVDASGSAAVQRLAEAKGAVELLLADCYVRRDRVALIAFRALGAELLLPPTRSLLRAKRALAGLPGGGGTPLASGLDAADALAESVRVQGSSPVLVVLTDGRANIARDGAANRERAAAEALAAARRLREHGITALVVDTAQRPRPATRALAEAMGATWMALPHADARSLSAAVRAGTGLGAAPARR